MTLLKIRQQKGVILIITFLILGILLLLGGYFLTFTLIESRIARSHEISSEAYYLAEAGINEAIWKLINDNTTLDGDEAWATNFITSPGCATWRASFTKGGTLFPDSSFTASIQNLECARGIITATSTIVLPEGRFSQRVVKATVYKAIGNPIQDSGVFTGGTGENIIIDDSRIRIERGNIFSNNNLIIRNNSLVEVFDNPATIDLEGQVLAVRNILINESSVSSTTRCAQNVCTPGCQKCPSDRIEMPAIDFDSAANPNSLKNRARVSQNNLQCQVLCNGIICSSKCIFTEKEFEDLLRRVGSGGILTLNNAITYIEGEVELRGGRSLVVNGILATDRDIEIGREGGRSHVTVQEPSVGGASGLLSKRKIYFEENSGFFNQVISITGVIYSLGNMEIDEVSERIEVRGAILANTLRINEMAKRLQITIDNTIINRVLHLTQPPGGGAPIIYSPVVIIEHWQEAY